MEPIDDEEGMEPDEDDAPKEDFNEPPPKYSAVGTARLRKRGTRTNHKNFPNNESGYLFGFYTNCEILTNSFKNSMDLHNVATSHVFYHFMHFPFYLSLKELC